MPESTSTLLLGTTVGPDGAALPVELPATAMLRHAVCLGSSGSGKTVAAKILMEECVRDGIPVIALDPQGDIASLLLKADKAKVEAKGTPGEVYDGYWDKADVVIWTPGSSNGIALSVNPLKLDFNHADQEDQIRAVSSVAETLANLIGYDSGKDDGTYVVAYLTKVFAWITARGQALESFTDLAEFLADPPEALAGSEA
jgi:DNA helicase HerA-like ATPase